VILLSLTEKLLQKQNNLIDNKTEKFPKNDPNFI